jgi:hypothetical protein
VVPSKQEGVGPVCKSFSEENKADGNAGGVDSPSESLSEIAQEAAVKVENNVVTSKNEGLKALPNVSSMVEGVGSLSTSLSEDNKDDVNAEGVGSPSIFLSRDKQVNMCENL